MDFPVAIGCREAVKCPVKPPARLCSRRDTGPESRETKDTSGVCDLFFFPLNLHLCVDTDLGLNHAVPLKSHLSYDVAHINLQRETTQLLAWDLSDDM